MTEHIQTIFTSGEITQWSESRRAMLVQVERRHVFVRFYLLIAILFPLLFTPSLSWRFLSCLLPSLFP